MAEPAGDGLATGWTASRCRFWNSTATVDPVRPASVERRFGVPGGPTAAPTSAKARNRISLGRGDIALRDATGVLPLSSK